MFDEQDMIGLFGASIDENGENYLKFYRYEFMEIEERLHDVVEYFEERELETIIKLYLYEYFSKFFNDDKEVYRKIARKLMQKHQ